MNHYEKTYEVDGKNLPLRTTTGVVVLQEVFLIADKIHLNALFKYYTY